MTASLFSSSPGRRLHAAGGALASLLALVGLLTAPATSAPDDQRCSLFYDCWCTATYKESNIQPGYSQSCIESIDVTVVVTKPGCCAGDVIEGEVCSIKKCEWDQIKVKVTPDGSCTLRVNGGAETTISAATEYSVPRQETNCKTDIPDAFKLEWRDEFSWTDVFELTFHCAKCSYMVD